MIYLLHPLYGNGYQLWSGIGSDVGEVTLIGGAITWYLKSRCHVDGCHKHGKYPFSHYRLCKNHHPAVPEKVTHLHILKLHKDNQGKYER